MKFDLKTMTPEQKKNLIVGGVAGAVILIALIYIITSQFGGGGQPEAALAPAPPGVMAPGEGASPVPQGVVPPEGSVPQPVSPGTAPPVAAPPGAAPPGAAAPVTPAQPAPPASAAAPTPNAPRTVTVFGSLVVTYAPGWGIGAGSSGSTAVITDGKGVFEVHAPDPNAKDAKSIANSAVATYAGGAPIISQGPKSIAGHEAYSAVVKGPKGTTRIVGVDAPTRVVLVEYAKGGQFAAYKGAFDNLESKLTFK